MSKLEALIQQLCPDGVEYKTINTLIKTNIVKVIASTIKIKRNDYKSVGTTPIVSQEEEFISGYCDCVDKNIPKGQYICFGDHSEHIKYVDFLFVQGADGLKIMKINNLFVLPKYFYYSIANFYKRHNSYERHFKYFTDTIIPIPPIEVQREIVRILDNFTELTARKKQYEYYRDRLINDAIGDSGKLIDLLSQPITDGPHTTPKLVPEGVPFISAAAVWDGKIHFEKAQGFITKDFDIECAKKYKPRRNDVFMVKSGSTTGKVAFVDTDADFNVWSPLAAMRTDNEITARYIYHFLQTSSAQNMVFTRMSHGSQPNLSMRTLEQFDIKIPSLDEQRRIVSILDRFDALCNDLTSGLPAEIAARQKQYEYYRDKLLTFNSKEIL